MVHKLSAEVQDALNSNLLWDIAQPPEAIPPVLVILNYAPDRGDGLLSIAFDLTAGPRCWFTAPRACQINGDGPIYHLDYRRFEWKGMTFHPYSVQSFPQDIFSCSVALFRACRQLHAHAVQD